MRFLPLLIWLVLHNLNAAHAAAVCYCPPRVPPPLPEYDAPAPHCVTNSLRGPFKPNTGRWTTVANGGFETGSLNGTPGHISKFIGFRMSSGPGAEGSATVTTNAAFRGRFGAELYLKTNDWRYGANLEPPWGFYLDPGQTYVISCLVRYPKRPSPASKIHMDLWNMPGEEKVFTDKDTTEWQMLWTRYSAEMAEFISFRIYLGGECLPSDVIYLDEIAVTPVNEFRFPEPTGAKSPGPLQALPPPPIEDVIIQPYSRSFTNTMLVIISEGGRRSTTRYTLDGTPPNAHSKKIDQVFTLDKTATITACAFTNGLPASHYVTRTMYRFEPLNPDGSLRNQPNRVDIEHTPIENVDYVIISKRDLSAPDWTSHGIFKGREVQSELKSLAAQMPENYFCVVQL